MITPSDPDYVESKLAKLGRHRLSPSLQELAEWVENYYRNVHVLNIRYDKVVIAGNRVPRLNVIFEFVAEKKRVEQDQTAAIASQFRTIVASRRDDAFDTENLFVIFSAFEKVARVEANWRITAEQAKRLSKDLEAFNIWEIRPSWEVAIFFFQTDAQLQASLHSDVRRACADAYGRLLNQYDEFGYFKREPIEVRFDSRLNFEKNYNGSWFNYDRG